MSNTVAILVVFILVHSQIFDYHFFVYYLEIQTFLKDGATLNGIDIFYPHN